jgi:phosphoglycerate dehydrogenase-like enzyme
MTPPRSEVRILTTLPAAALARVKATVPGTTVITVPSEGPLPAGTQGDVLLIPPWDPGNLEAIVAAGVGWIHTVGTGVDRVPLDVVGDRVLTCSRGASGIPIAEWVLAMMLAFTKKLPEAWIHEPPATATSGGLGGLYGARLGLVGFGGIGQAVARHALSFGMRVTTQRRSGAPSQIPGVAVVTDLSELLADSDHVVLGLPLIPETRHLINAESLAAIPAEAGIHLVNVSRGGVVDHDALRVALEDGRVAMASLDVVEPEPLPKGHWIYQHPQIRHSPHLSWSMPLAFDLLLDTFIANLERYKAGEPLEGRVDTKLGY